MSSSKLDEVDAKTAEGVDAAPASVGGGGSGGGGKESESKSEAPSKGVKPKLKSSTTSTLYISSTLSVPDNDELTLGVSTVLYCQMLADQGPDGERPCPPAFEAAFELFNEENYTRDPKAKAAPATIETIFSYVKQIFELAQFSPECNVLALVYINRLISFTKLPINARNWRLLVLASLLLAQKVWDDRCLANVDFPIIWETVVPGAARTSTFDVKSVNKLEKMSLELLQYNVTVSSSLYAKYYFELRTLAEDNDRHFRLKPLTTEQAKRLEARSSSRRILASTTGGRRVHSMSDVRKSDEKTAPAKSRAVLS